MQSTNPIGLLSIQEIEEHITKNHPETEFRFVKYPNHANVELILNEKYVFDMKCRGSNKNILISTEPIPLYIIRLNHLKTLRFLRENKKKNENWN